MNPDPISVPTQEIVEFLQQLVAIPSFESEKAIADQVAEKLFSLGFSPQIIGQAEHPSVLSFFQKENSNQTIWLQAHLDTAPLGDISQWQYPPLSGTIIDHKMYGRGVADSKAAIALFIYLAKALRESPNFNSSIFLGFDAQEESGNFTGIKEIIKHAPPAALCVLGYQSWDEISIGARGWLRLKLTTKGQAAHTGSRSQKGVNAIHQMVKAISTLLELELEAKTSPFFEFGSAVNFSQITGGTSINVVPSQCESLIDIRLIPSQKGEDVIHLIQDKLQSLKREESSFNYSLDILQHEPAYLTDSHHPFVQILQTKAQALAKIDVPLVASGAGSVGNVIHDLGIPIVNAYGCRSGNVHAPNEWLDLTTIEPVFRIYFESLLQWKI